MYRFILGLVVDAVLLFLVHKVSKPSDTVDSNGKSFVLFMFLMIATGVLLVPSLVQYGIQEPLFFASLLIIPLYWLAFNWKRFQEAEWLSDIIPTPSKTIGGLLFSIAFLWIWVMEGFFPYLHENGGPLLTIFLMGLGGYFRVVLRPVPQRARWPLLGGVFAVSVFFYVLNLARAWG